MKKFNNEIIISKFNKFYFLIIFFMLLIFSSYIYYKYTSLEYYTDKIITLNKELENANKKNKELIEQTKYKTSDEYIEKIARDKLGMVKNNEIVFYDSEK